MSSEEVDVDATIKDLDAKVQRGEELTPDEREAALRWAKEGKGGLGYVGDDEEE